MIGRLVQQEQIRRAEQDQGQSNARLLAPGKRVHQPLTRQLFDPQTSGGLLVSCTPDSVDAVLAVFRRHGFDSAAVIGEVAAAETPRLVVR